jgi:4'-phosphopantetheinyl transferase EntD
MIETLFPKEVETLFATSAMWSGALLPEEEACLSPRAVEKRRREFTAGRVAARAVLERFGIRDFPLLVGADRAPVWPPGIVGSLSHCGDLCGVAAARRESVAGVGFDAESDRELEPPIAERVCSEAELLHLAGLPGAAARWATVVFCAKESTYKCHSPLAGTFLDFHDVEVRLEPDAARFVATIHRARGPNGEPVTPIVRTLHGRFVRHGSYVLTGVTLNRRDLHGSPPKGRGPH